ncbi:hypothetical protein HanPI659440_Chr03g0114821 [Helianthus annuus]|nr:hypothetical protein HanPI659440_Chr03g0114821 [Helianthus annuus]
MDQSLIGSADSLLLHKTLAPLPTSPPPHLLNHRHRPSHRPPPPCHPPTVRHHQRHALRIQRRLVSPNYPRGRGKDTDKGHNVHCVIDAENTDGTVVEKMAKFLRESRVAKALFDRTTVYESHVRCGL